MVPIQNVKMAVGPIWNTGGTEMEISVPVSVLGPQVPGHLATKISCYADVNRLVIIGSVARFLGNI